MNYSAELIGEALKNIELNALQMAAVIANQRYGIKNIDIEAGRGVGKSTILGYFMKEAVDQMPRATGVLVGETYVQIKSRTLPSTKEGLEMFGIYENIDYVVGKCGGEGYEMPFQAPNSWANVIHFRNGFIWVMVSLDDPNAGRGLNAYIVMGDEAALLREERLFNNVLITNRARKVQFENKSLCNAQIFASTVAMTKTGEWFTNREKLSLEEVKNKVPLHKRKHMFIKGNALINKHNLREGYFEDMRKQAISKLHYDAEILNIRPKGVTEGFYSQLDASRHYYYHKYDTAKLQDIPITETFVPSCKYDTDLVRGKNLELNLDFGGRINCATVSQYLESINEARFLKEFYVKGKDKRKLNDLVKDFIDYYEPHKSSCNIIHLYHDKSGFKEQENSITTLAEDVTNLLTKAGWVVINMTPETNNPSHILKFRLINTLLAEEDYTLPRIRINADNCPNLIISMENAPIKLTGKDGFEKDKSSEKSKVIKQEEATHLSDTLDYNLYHHFSYLLDPEASNSFIITNL